MTEEFDVNAWMVRVNSRGVSGLFTDKTPDDKQSSEYLQLSCWMDGMRESFEVDVAEHRAVAKDPPDFEVRIDDHWSSVELTEFVNGPFLKKVAMHRRIRINYNAYHGEGFVDAQWNKAKFLEHLNELIDKKAERLINQSISVDILVVATAEPWLYRTNVQEWLSGEYPKSKIDPFNKVYIVMG
ncbi:MAG: hypothetical protein AAFU41_02480 [Pseudomonadota bacterium]